MSYISWQNVYGFDTETDNDGVTAWVCQWCIHTGANAYTGRSVPEFEDRLRRLISANEKICLYVFNLKYDLEFIKSVLHNLESDGFIPKYIIRKGSPIKVQLKKGPYVVEFRDAMKKMPGNLRSLGRMIGLEKLESPLGFYPGWSNDLNYDNPASWDYVKRDAEIVAVAMQSLHKGNKDGYKFDRATLSGDAWKIAKDMIGTSNGKSHGNEDNWRWDAWFPRLSADLDRQIRRAYFGGINLSPPHNHGVRSKKMMGHKYYSITHEDIHNSYGAVMMWRPLPYGMPTVQYRFPPSDMLYIAEVRIKLHIKPEYRGNEWYQFKNGIDNTIEGWEHGTVVSDTQEWHELSLTSVDLDLLEDWYNVEYDEWYKPTIYVFKSRAGLLAPYLDYFTKIKESSPKNGLEYTHAKRMINSFYGRTGLAPETSDTSLIWDDELEDWNWSTEYTIEEDHDAYIPYATFCTAWARKTLLDNVRACLDQIPNSVIHCDTDSVIHYGPPVEHIPHGEHLGTWGIESNPPIIIEAGFKRYVELKRYPIQSMDDVIGMALAGVPQQKDHNGVPIGMWVEILDEPKIITIDGYTLGNEHYKIQSEWLRQIYLEHGMNPDDVDTMKLIPVRVPGGVILDKRQHRMNDNLVWRLRR